jgi:hypothetical protein
MSLPATFIKPWLPKTEPPSLLFTHVNLIDPVDGKVYADVSVQLAQGVTAAISLDQQPIQVPDNTITLDISGKSFVQD